MCSRVGGGSDLHQVAALSTAKGDIRKNIRKAMVYGSVTAAFCCEGFGLNKTTKTTRKNIDVRVKELEAITSF